MKLLFTLSIVTLLFTSACSDDDGTRIVGSGVIVSENRPLDSFNKIHISSVINANIIYNTNSNVEVRADDNIIDLITTSVSQGTLFINLEDGSYDDMTIEVNVANPTLSSITLVGVNTIEVSEFEQLDRLDVSIKGVGSVKMNGSAGELTVNSSGSSNLDAFDFTAGMCDITLSGVGNVQITVEDELTGSLSGVGNILYRGSPSVSVSVTGVGNVVNAN